jgi:hypothetical protein
MATTRTRKPKAAPAPAFTVEMTGVCREITTRTKSRLYWQGIWSIRNAATGKLVGLACHAPLDVEWDADESNRDEAVAVATENPPEWIVAQAQRLNGGK